MVYNKPPKQPRPRDLPVQSIGNRHVWVAVATYRLTEDEALDAHVRGTTIWLDDDHHFRTSPVLCYLCEKHYLDAHKERCTGDPTEARMNIEKQLEEIAHKSLESQERGESNDRAD